MAKKRESFTMKYVGPTPETTVRGFGKFKKEKEVTYKDAAMIKKAEHLVKHNANFQEVK